MTAPSRSPLVGSGHRPCPPLRDGAGGFSPLGGRGSGTICGMAATPTTTVEIDSGLLEQLRERDRGRSDRELLEDLAVVELGFETIRRAQERNAGADEDEVMTEAVKAGREARAEIAAERRRTAA